MKYTKGQAGPVSRMHLEIIQIHHFDEDGPQSRARGQGMATLARGKLKGVSFLAQGRHQKRLKAALETSTTVELTVRWTARDEVTVMEVHPPVAKAA